MGTLDTVLALLNNTPCVYLGQPGLGMFFCTEIVTMNHQKTHGKSGPGCLPRAEIVEVCLDYLER